MKLKPGQFLLSEPFMEDEVFAKSIILLMDYDILEGSFGLILNQTMPYDITDFLTDFPMKNKSLNFGGPVDTKRLFYIHRKSNIPNAIGLSQNLFFAGDLDVIRQAYEQGDIKAEDIQFYLGYAGWSSGQLEEEIQEQSWIVSDQLILEDIVFSKGSFEAQWKDAFLKLGGKYKEIVNYPFSNDLN
ncbi:MAG: YqgE/AlgH family protein [Chitinophagales bacterium]|jgi:putative transcriptional regulator|nr:YqgE/AlgH family protein [Chitinophagales bacterium]